jgi:adenylate kinase
LKKLFRNISFIGGIHGVGKSTICEKICTDLNIQYISASETLKWAEINSNINNKNVANISLTQNRLITGLTERILNKNHYLLDGHFCLLDEYNKIVKVPFETFEIINPISIHVIIGDILEIKSRLELRDDRSYDYQLLESMQLTEIEYASELSNKLNIDLSIGNEKNYSEILKSLQTRKL